MQAKLANIKLTFYKPDTVVSNVKQFIIQLKVALIGRYYNKDHILEYILPNIEPTFDNWTNVIRDQLAVWKSYDELYEFLSEKAMSADTAFRLSGVSLIKNPFKGVQKPDKPAKVNAAKERTYPKGEDHKCEICEKHYPKEQTHGFASNYDGSNPYCPDWSKFPDRVAAYLTKRKAEIDKANANRKAGGGGAAAGNKK